MVQPVNPKPFKLDDPLFNRLQLGSVGQYLALRHDTTDYNCFLAGILLALRKIGSLDPGVTVGLERLLGV